MKIMEVNFDKAMVIVIGTKLEFLAISTQAESLVLKHYFIIRLVYFQGRLLNVLII